MQLDTRLPLLAAQQPALQFQPETRLESLGKIAPAINAMRQMQAQQIDMEKELRKRQAFDQFRSEMKKAGMTGGPAEMAKVLFTYGETSEHFKLGADFMKVAQEEARNRRLFGPSEDGMPAGDMPAARPAAAAPATTQAPASEVAPEMAFYGAGGGRPANALMAMEAPAPAMPAQTAAPQGYSFAGRTYSAAAVQEMLTRQDTRSLGLKIIEANEPKRETTPEKQRLMQALGYPMTREGFAAFEEAQRAPQRQTSEFENYLNAKKDDGFTGTFYQYQEKLRKAGASKINLPELEKKEQQEKGTLNVKQFDEISKTAKSASRILPSLETQERILNAGFQTGFGTAAKKAAASLLSALDVPEAENFASNAETFIAAMNQAVLQRQLEQKGTQTQADADRITATGAQLGNTVRGNKFIIAVAKAQLKRDIAQSRFWENHWRKNKTYEGAEEAWQSGLGGKSLFDAPELREFVQATAPARATTEAGSGAAPRPSGGGVDRSNPLLQQ